MNIWGIVSIVVAVIGFIIGAVYKIDSYINDTIEIRYNQKVAELLIDKQNKAIKEWQLNTTLFKKTNEIKKEKIIKEVEYIQVKDDTCEAKLEAINKLVEMIYSR